AVAGHSARMLGGRVLAVSDAGEHMVLSPADYRRYLAGRVKDDEPLSRELVARGLARHGLDLAALPERFASRNLLDWPGPNVHTVVLTQRCNLKCVYCHASVVGEDRAG